MAQGVRSGKVETPLVEPPAPQPAARITDKRRSAPFKSSKLVKPATGYPQKVSGSGQLPELENVQWEKTNKGGIEAWHVPLGVTARKGKTYLGFLGKRRLAGLLQLSDQEVVEMLTDCLCSEVKEKSFLRFI